MRESDIESYLVQQVELYGGLTRKLRWIGRNGAPDRFVKFPASPVALVELKRPGGRVREGQKREMVRLKIVGVDVWLIDNKADVDRFVQTQRMKNENRY